MTENTVATFKGSILGVTSDVTTDDALYLAREWQLSEAPAAIAAYVVMDIRSEFTVRAYADATGLSRGTVQRLKVSGEFLSRIGVKVTPEQALVVTQLVNIRPAKALRATMAGLKGQALVRAFHEEWAAHLRGDAPVVPADDAPESDAPESAPVDTSTVTTIPATTESRLQAALVILGAILRDGETLTPEQADRLGSVAGPLVAKARQSVKA